MAKIECTQKTKKNKRRTRLVPTLLVVWFKDLNVLHDVRYYTKPSKRSSVQCNN